MTSIPGAYRERLHYTQFDEPDMSQVDVEMPTMEEYKRWEDAFTGHLGFTSPEFNFKLMRFIGASRNMIDELKPMLQNPNTRAGWDTFIQGQKDHKLILRALTAVVLGVEPGTRNEPIFRPRGKKTKTKTKTKTKVKARTSKKKRAKRAKK